MAEAGPPAASGTCLVTGGAGFLGCAVSGQLPDHFDRVVAFDNLHPQVHARAQRPAALDHRVELVRGDVTVASDWDRLLDDVRPTVILHLAAETGTAQSLTQATRHARVNVVGTTEMLDALVRHEALPERVVLASSRAVYGEGAWADIAGAVSYPGQRTPAMLRAGQWDFPGLKPLPADSSRTRTVPTSVYGATKLAQENVLTTWCLAEDVLPVVFRLQNVYGPGQSLTNPHTGVVSYFAQLAKAGQVIPVYEDGQVVRDFVYIEDVTSALIKGVLEAATTTHPCDIGSGRPATMLEVARLIAQFYGSPPPEINGGFRHGDVRAGTCDIAGPMVALNWAPHVMIEEGMKRLCEWVASCAT